MPQGSKEAGEYKEKNTKFPTRLLPQHSDQPPHPPRGHIPSLESYGQSISARGGHTAPRMLVTIPGRWGSRSTEPSAEKTFGDSDVPRMLFW